MLNTEYNVCRRWISKNLLALKIKRLDKSLDASKINENTNQTHSTSSKKTIECLYSKNIIHDGTLINALIFVTGCRWRECYSANRLRPGNCCSSRRHGEEFVVWSQWTLWRAVTQVSASSSSLTNNHKTSFTNSSVT